MTAAWPRKGRIGEAEGMSNLFKRKLNASLVRPWMEAQVQGVFLGAFSIMRKSERNARLG